MLISMVNVVSSVQLFFKGQKVAETFIVTKPEMELAV
jgi:hypothetical protein